MKTMLLSPENHVDFLPLVSFLSILNWISPPMWIWTEDTGVVKEPTVIMRISKISGLFCKETMHIATPIVLP